MKQRKDREAAVIDGLPNWPTDICRIVASYAAITAWFTKTDDDGDDDKITITADEVRIAFDCRSAFACVRIDANGPVGLQIDIIDGDLDKWIFAVGIPSESITKQNDRPICGRACAIALTGYDCSFSGATTLLMSSYGLSDVLSVYDRPLPIGQRLYHRSRSVRCRFDPVASTFAVGVPEWSGMPHWIVPAGSWPHLAVWYDGNGPSVARIRLQTVS
jgi:hypothetical protein